MKKIRIIAIISALVTAVAVYLYLSSLNKPVDIPKLPVVVAAVQIKEGTEIKQDMVTTIMLPAEAIVNRAAKSADEVVGRISSTTVEVGEQLLVSRFYKTGETTGGLAVAVEKGKRAFTVAVDSVTGVAGLIRPRDNVDVLVIIGVTWLTDPDDPQSTSITKTYSKTLLQNIKVLATGQTIVPGSDVNKPETVDTVTLSVTPEQAVDLNYAASEGKIRLVLRSPIDSDTPDLNQVDVGDLVEYK